MLEKVRRARGALDDPGDADDVAVLDMKSRSWAAMDVVDGCGDRDDLPTRGLCRRSGSATPYGRSGRFGSGVHVKGRVPVRHIGEAIRAGRRRATVLDPDQAGVAQRSALAGDGRRTPRPTAAGGASILRHDR